jgi:hypothetical protein
MAEQKLLVLENKVLSVSDIQSRIFTFRGVQVMLDRDLAIQYKVATKALNQAVKRNIRRFPERFMFQLTKEEFENWKSQIVTSNIYSKDEIEALKMGARRCPFVFTEQGVAQLSAVLHSDVAADASVMIMDAFVAMRRFITANAGLFQRVDLLEQRQLSTEKKLDVVLDKLEDLSPAVTSEQLFATGCVWDAYTFVCDLIRSAEKRLVLIDNFVDERVLTMLDKRNVGVEATVHTRYTEQVMLDFEKHNKQYAPIEYVQMPHAVHDRYLIVDDTVWLLGASVKDMGRGLCTVIKVGFRPEMVIGLAMK